MKEIRVLRAELRQIEQQVEKASQWRKRFALTSTALFLLSVVLLWIEW